MRKFSRKAFSSINRKEVFSWLSGIKNYAIFVSRRRVDKRFGILPSHATNIKLGAIFLLVSGFSAVYLDALYLNWYEYEYKLRYRLFNPITGLGNSMWSLLITGCMMLICSFFRSDRFNGAKQVAWNRIFLSFYFLFTNVSLSGVVAVVLKNTIGKARPQYAMYTDGIDLWTFIPFADKYTYASFPSGHATTAGALLAACWILFPKWGWLAMPIGLYVAVSRTAIGVHYPSDVLAGLMLGIFFTLIYARLFARKRLLFNFDHEGKLRLRGETKNKV